MLEDQTNHEQLPAVDESETDLCTALWISVALQAVVDARSESSKGKMQQYKRQAVKWLKASEGENSEFAMVCSLANLDFERTRTRLLKVIRNKNECADFRCIKKALLDNRGMELRSKYLKRMKRQEKTRAEQKILRVQKLAHNAIKEAHAQLPSAQCC